MLELETRLHEVATIGVPRELRGLHRTTTLMLPSPASAIALVDAYNVLRRAGGRKFKRWEKTKQLLQCSDLTTTVLYYKRNNERDGPHTAYGNDVSHFFESKLARVTFRAANQFQARYILQILMGIYRSPRPGCHKRCTGIPVLRYEDLAL